MKVILLFGLTLLSVVLAVFSTPAYQYGYSQYSQPIVVSGGVSTGGSVGGFGGFGQIFHFIIILFVFIFVISILFPDGGFGGSSGGGGGRRPRPRPPRGDYY